MTIEPGLPARCVSVVVPTRNRASHAEACVASVLANEGDAFDLLVVDQSADDRTERALEPFRKDSRFHYRRTRTTGVSRSRNVGIRATSSPLIAFTDDDCRVATDWVSRISAPLEGDPETALVFGRVTVPEDVNGTHRYAASFEPDRREYQNEYPAPGGAWGIGANMAIRRDVLARVGLFDPMLGPGATFPAAEEYDVAVRVLSAGMKIVHASEASVLHVGVREGRAASELVRGYGVAIGAALAKHLRLGTNRHLLGDWVLFHGMRAARNCLTGVRPTNLGFVKGLVTGAARASFVPVDAARFVFIAEPDGEPVRR